ncbi:hypothetical protein ACJMK2_006594 [Sinanodonta woodiana]|uniref:TIR domain-containing protein n=1 Tax=Sinanodonta woodiana TaxID=1069815 RepID=A0ABD3VWF5_SINWO
MHINAFILISIQFTFWPLSREQEGQLKIKQIVTEERSIFLKRKYEKPKVGIKGRDGQPVGFIFSDFSVHLNKARQDVYEQVLSYKGICRNFQFLDPNGWPVGAQQETVLTVMDILVGSCITVDVKLAPSPKRDAEFSPPDRLPIKRLKGFVLRDLSFRSSKDVERQQSADSSNVGVTSSTVKQILISYVRAEAAEHAVTLKEELSALGFSVYLDVHEISSGVDWQDSLNFAVSNCETFVPLVTHRYGETQWTNREVKLADVLGKFIIPVSFLETWPPRCLAIQFASTQYILWKPLDQLSPDMPSNNDIRKWERKYVQMVAGQIGDRVKKLNMCTQDALERVPSLIKRKTILKSCACVTESNSQAVTSDREGHPLIVVCLHPAEKEFGAQLQTFLETKNYDVWCTTELQIDYADSIPASQEVDNQQLASLQRFQEKADEAGVILFVLSKAFAKSRTCQQQVFYCEHRKRVIPIQYEQFCMPGWMRMLIGTKGQETVSDETHKEALLCRLRRALDPTARESAGATMNEAKISCAVERLRQTLDIDTCVYIAGSTKFYNQSSEAICRSIGVNLAALDMVTLVTGGFYGVGETVGRSFYEESQRLFHHHDTWHILPEYDTQDRGSQAQQNKDGTFQLINYGKTLFLGDSVRERETIVARAFNICILVEGGPGAAHEVDEFSWNDHSVIPVCCTGGAAGGSFNNIKLAAVVDLLNVRLAPFSFWDQIDIITRLRDGLINMTVMADLLDVKLAPFTLRLNKARQEVFFLILSSIWQK